MKTFYLGHNILEALKNANADKNLLDENHYEIVGIELKAVRLRRVEWAKQPVKTYTVTYKRI